MSTPLARRALLQGAATVLLLGLPLSFVSCSEDAKRSSASNPEIVEGYFPGERLAAARLIGEHWLRVVAPNATRAEIRGIVAPTEERAARATDIDEAVRMLTAQVQQDFEREDLVDVEGWVLSITEVHLCVIAGLRG